MAKEKTGEPEQKQYLTTPGNYNRESGTKTLRLVAIMIAAIAILATLSLILVNQ